MFTGSVFQLKQQEKCDDKTLDASDFKSLYEDCYKDSDQMKSLVSDNLLDNEEFLTIQEFMQSLKHFNS